MQFFALPVVETDIALLQTLARVILTFYNHHQALRAPSQYVPARVSTTEFVRHLEQHTHANVHVVGLAQTVDNQPAMRTATITEHARHKAIAFA